MPPVLAGGSARGQFERVLVLDFGAQYSQLIARRVREAHVFSEIVRATITASEVKARAPVGLILSGGPSSVYVDDAPAIDPTIFDLGIPVLGICYGHQLIAQTRGGVVTGNDVAEYGGTEIAIDPASVLFVGLGEKQAVWMSHRDSVTAAPAGFRVTGRSTTSGIAAMEDPDRGVFGLQFHPEVAHTPRGQDMLKRFLYDACGARPTWTHLGIIEESVAAIRGAVGDATVLCALSGGVDSCVAAALVHKAIGDQLVCVLVDHGLMRHGEAAQVDETFQATFHMNLVHVKAEDRFLDALAGITDPEAKRKVIGETFIRVFEEVAAEIPGVRFLVQGTLYPDVIESGHGEAARIKSHHNVAGLPADMTFDLIEPLRDLFKDEVRSVGEELGLPEEIVWRQPFPGPGLAVRIIGEVTRERLEILREADAIVLEEVRRAGMYRDLWQTFGILAGIRTVGVQGDDRTYAYPLIVRAVTSEDAMTADWARLPYDLLDRISSRVINEVPGINRVAYDVSSKPPATIEWE